MSDLIKRSDAIKVLKDSVVEMGGDDFCEMGVHIDDIEAVVNAIPSADRPSESMGKLIERMEEYRDQQLLMSDYWYGINWAINTIRTADISDRPSGEWLWQLADNGWADHICSVCGYTKNTDIHVSLNWSYCPHCGSKMRGEHDD